MNSLKKKMIGPYWVYEYVTPDNMIYVGVSKQKYFHSRCRENQYSTTALQPYIDKFGFDSFKIKYHDCLSYEEAYKLENELILKYSEKNISINKNRSGLEVKYYKNHKQQVKNNQKKLYEIKKQKNNTSIII